MRAAIGAIDDGVGAPRQFILQTALDRRYGKTEPLVPLNDTLELNAHNYMEQRLSK